MELLDIRIVLIVGQSDAYNISCEEYLVVVVKSKEAMSHASHCTSWQIRDSEYCRLVTVSERQFTKRCLLRFIAEKISSQRRVE